MISKSLWLGIKRKNWGFKRIEKLKAVMERLEALHSYSFVKGKKR